MTAIQKPLARWILIVTAIFAVLEILVSVALCISPESVADNVDLGARGVTYLIFMWAARQFALGFIFAFATVKRSVPMLTLAYIFFLVMMVGDMVIGVVMKENSMVIAGLLMCVVAVAMLYVINKKSRLN